MLIGRFPCAPHPAAGMSRVDPGRLQGPGSTRLRVASSVTKDHVREPTKEADHAIDELIGAGLADRDKIRWRRLFV